MGFSLSDIGDTLKKVQEAVTPPVPQVIQDGVQAAGQAAHGAAQAVGQAAGQAFGGGHNAPSGMREDPGASEGDPGTPVARATPITIPVGQPFTLPPAEPAGPSYSNPNFPLKPIPPAEGEAGASPEDVPSSEDLQRLREEQGEALGSRGVIP